MRSLRSENVVCQSRLDLGPVLVLDHHERPGRNAYFLSSSRLAPEMMNGGIDLVGRHDDLIGICPVTQTAEKSAADTVANQDGSWPMALENPLPDR